MGLERSKNLKIDHDRIGFSAYPELNVNPYDF
jgi:hypothetical protein